MSSRGQAFALGRRLAPVVAAALVVGGCALADGSRGAAGAGLGLVMVIGFFAGGRAVMAVAGIAQPGVAFLLVAMSYLLRVLLLLVVLKATTGADWLDRKVVAGTVIAGAIAWTFVLVARHLTSRQPTLVVESPARSVVPR